MIHDLSTAAWPRSLLALPLAALVFALQAVPGLGLFMVMLRAEFWPGVLLYAAIAGVAYEAISGRVPSGWLMFPAIAVLLSVVPRWLETEQVAHERARVASKDQPGAGPGADGVGVVVDRPEIAHILVRRYAVTFAAARRDLTSVDFVVYRRSPHATGAVTASALAEEPPGALVVSRTAYGFSRGWLEGYDLLTTARWPDGRERARVAVGLHRISLPAFPIAGGEMGPWISQMPVRIRLARPIEQRFGYFTPDSPEAEATDIARLIGLVPLVPRSSAGPAR